MKNDVQCAPAPTDESWQRNLGSEEAVCLIKDNGAFSTLFGKFCTDAKPNIHY